MYKIDLHTHSIISHDGGITKNQYKRILKKGILDIIAITDHNQTHFARSMQSEIGDRIIVGEEIKTLQGEIIGLYLKNTIPSGLSAEETVFKIKNDGGLVYIPHPFEKSRHSMQQEAIKSIIKDVDIIEVFNARGFLRGKADAVRMFAEDQRLSVAASSDAHCARGIGSAYSSIKKLPDEKSLSGLLKEAILARRYAPSYTYLCPSVNRIKNQLFLGV